MSFALEPGRITALVGPSGAGKSTVLNLLLGFVANQQGSIRINGQSLAEVEPASWLAQVAWVPQRAHVFLGSVRDNIQIANPAASFDAVRAAAQQAGADDFIMALPNGYDTPLGRTRRGPFRRADPAPRAGTRLPQGRARTAARRTHGPSGFRNAGAHSRSPAQTRARPHGAARGAPSGHRASCGPHRGAGRRQGRAKRDARGVDRRGRAVPRVDRRWR